MRPLPQKTIGILGGMSDQATMAYYKMINTLTRDIHGGWDIAEILIQSVNFGNIEYFIRNDLWDEASDYLVSKAKLAQLGGADLLICVSNTLHKVMDDVQAAIDIPVIHIADPTGAEIQKQGLKTIGLLGTLPTMADSYMRDYYKTNFDIEIIVPSEQDQKIVDDIIFNELVKGVITKASQREYVRVCGALQDRGAQGAILGCTEIFMLLAQNDLPDLPLYNTTALHAKAVVEFAAQD